MHFVQKRRRIAALIAFALVGGACADPTASNLRSVQVVLGTSALVIPPNDTTSLAVYVVRHNVVEPLDIVAIGLPAGVTSADGSIDAFVSQGKLMLRAGSAMSVWQDLMIRVSGPGVAPVFARLSLTVR